MRYFFSFVLAFSFFYSSFVQATQPNYLKITTADGKTLQAPVKSFKGLSLGVIATLVKQGKMTNPPENPGQGGYMTFYLDKTVGADFVTWAAMTKTAASGQFQWVDSHGKKTITFTMTGVHVSQFTTADAKSTNGGTLVILADETVADPPIDFSKKK
jgi:hypothetical protein